MLATYSDFRVNSVFIRLSMRPAIKAHSVRIMGKIPPVVRDSHQCQVNVLQVSWTNTVHTL